MPEESNKQETNKPKRVSVGQGAEAFFREPAQKENQQERKPETEQSSKIDNAKTALPVTRQSGNLEKEQGGKADKSKYGKAGYRVSPEDSVKMEEMRLDLRRRLGRKVYFEDMLSVMIDHAQRDLAEFGDASFLVRRLKQIEEK